MGSELINTHIYMWYLQLLYYFMTLKGLFFGFFLFLLMRNWNIFLDVSVEIPEVQCLLLEIPTECLKKKAIFQLSEIEDLIAICTVCYTFV